MDKILVVQNRHWKNQPYTDLFDRRLVPVIIEKLKLREIEVLIGIRRSGKSTLFKLLINRLMQQVDPGTILYVNLDDPFFSDIWQDPRSLHGMVETAERITGKKIVYLFLDEVQNVRQWERFVKSAYDSETFRKIFITGSNSALLKSNYANLLSGRFVIDDVYPLSISEILSVHGLQDRIAVLDNLPFVLNLCETMLHFGSFPEVFKIREEDFKREVLVNYYDTIVLKDCIANSALRETRIFKELAYYLLSNIGGLFSYNSLAKAVNSNENTVREFLSVLEDSFLIRELRDFSFSLKQQSKSRKKSYSMDNGLIHAVSFAFSENRGRLLENLVYTELLKRGCKEIYFSQNQKECDFIVKTGTSFTALQVAYELNSRNRKREIDGLKSAMSKYDIKNGLIVTANQEETIQDHIVAVPFWKWNL